MRTVSAKIYRSE